MASVNNIDGLGFRGKVATKTGESTIPRTHDGATDNKKGIRLLFLYCLVTQVFSAYRAYEIYQNYDSWDNLTGKNKFFLAWGVGTTAIMVIFTVAYAFSEYQWRNATSRAKI
ncbi:hypothetical protein E8E14_000416 [Neopestalotiopsis sp. 37M]|nr:hypothetical protein E8E14_000416 [Neopestalotiopsis sp. 37M]